jgi:hypothetical protein
VPSGQHRRIDHPRKEAAKGHARTSVKRQRVDDAPTQRATRQKLATDKAVDRQFIPVDDTPKKATTGSSFLKSIPLAIDHDAPGPSSPIRKTYGKLKRVASRTIQQGAPHASPSARDENIPLPSKLPVPKTTVTQSKKAISKPKSTTKGPTQATSSSSKAPTVKREAKGPRQPRGACTSCRSRHQACDRAHPVCGRCAKSDASCEYPHIVRSGKQRNAVPSITPEKEETLSKKVSASRFSPKNKVRERSVTVSPRPLRKESSTGRLVTATPTAASFREPRARFTQYPEQVSPRKQK